MIPTEYYREDVEALVKRLALRKAHTVSQQDIDAFLAENSSGPGNRAQKIYQMGYAQAIAQFKIAFGIDLPEAE